MTCKILSRFHWPELDAKLSSVHSVRKKKSFFFFIFFRQRPAVFVSCCETSMWRLAYDNETRAESEHSWHDRIRIIGEYDLPPTCSRIVFYLTGQNSVEFAFKWFSWQYKCKRVKGFRYKEHFIDIIDQDGRRISKRLVVIYGYDLRSLSLQLSTLNCNFP